ncbi:hypothetical protein ACRWQL_04940 [Shewanella sp. HL-SH4]|uniref:hypothetical protein n=1 Tax=Shewanella TaxID=22 RepID=UPI001CF8A598|nr:hypothetical protein [Shewanella glacialimarina]UCX05483.1 hypothetical protein FJ709_13905 [Shewanella glacialimarina]
MNALQIIGGVGQTTFGLGLMSNPVTFVPGAILFAHGLANTVQGTGLSGSNYAQKGWRGLLGKQYGDYTYYGVDIASAGWSALGRKLGQFSAKASRTSTIHHSSNINNALGRSNVYFRGDFIRNYQTVTGSSLAINDGLVIQYGMRHNAD